MKLSAFIAAASVAFAIGQEVTFDPETGAFRCPTASGIYCAGDSLASDIIIRCTNFVGQPGRCSNNLAGQPPIGTNPARCYASATQDGIAACEKNCIVYGGSGNTGPDFNLPGCIPYDETVVSSITPAASSSTVASTSDVITTSASVSSPTLAITISSASVSSNPAVDTTISSESPSITISASNPILTVTGPSDTPPRPGPETTFSASIPVLTVSPPTYGPGPQPSYLPPGFYNTTITFTSRSTTLTYAPPIEPTTATLEAGTTVYIPVPVPTTVTFEDTTYTYGPEIPVSTTDSAPTIIATDPGTTIVSSNPTVTSCTRSGDSFGCDGPDVGTTLTTATAPDTTIVSTLPLPTTTFVGPSYTAAPTGGVGGGDGGSGGNGGNGGGNGENAGNGDGGSGSGSSGNGTYTIPSPPQTGGPSNIPVGPPITTSGIPSYTGAAASNAAGFGLVIIGLAAAFAL